MCAPTPDLVELCGSQSGEYGAVVVVRLSVVAVVDEAVVGVAVAAVDWLAALVDETGVEVDSAAVLEEAVALVLADANGFVDRSQSPFQPYGRHHRDFGGIPRL